MSEDTGEKTEQPTHFKLLQARKKGQVYKSQDLSSALSVLGGGLFLAFFVSLGVKTIWHLTQEVFRGASEPNLSSTLESFKASTWVWFYFSLPVLGGAFLASLGGGLMQVGFLFSTETIKFDLKKIDPISGLKQIFSMKRLVELIKQLLKFGVIAWVLFYLIKAFLPSVVLLVRADPNECVLLGQLIINRIFLYTLICFFIIGILDLFYQRYAYLNKLKMSKYEIKKEYKQNEGDPEIKYERKRLAQEWLFESNPKQIQKADAVIVNPQHLAVAIKYEPEKQAPEVVAKGEAFQASRIRKIAQKAQVPIIRNVPLAQALYELNPTEPIPPNLFEAVAEVLAFVYDISHKVPPIDE